MKNNWIILGIILIIILAISAFRYYQVKSSGNANEDMVVAVQDFLHSLDNDQLTKASFPLESDERFDWHYVPRERNGLAFKNMTEEQQEKARNIMRVALSEDGFNKATSIIALEEILRELEGRPEGDTYRDSENYSFSIFGTPTKENVWGWRVEGHHLSLNFSSATNEIISGTPAFMGSNPAVVPSGKEKGLQILKDEEDHARALLSEFSDEQLKKVIISEEAPEDIITTNEREAELGEFKGISVGDMNNRQRELLLKLLDVYIQNYNQDLASDFMNRIESKGIENIYFAWAGSTDKNGPHYYRLHGPNLIIEYDNTQNNANHVHTVIRDLENDFGGDLLKKHYEHGHQH
ncbi:DUF3500 domain-containing protein [soil metagenome]